MGGVPSYTEATVEVWRKFVEDPNNSTFRKAWTETIFPPPPPPEKHEEALEAMRGFAEITRKKLRGEN